jgi:hypothetical protein
MLKGLIRRSKPLLALAATVILALVIGHLAAGPSSPAPRNQFDEILPRALITTPSSIEVQVQLPSGEPAINAVVVMLEPELSASHTDSQGVARLWHIKNGPVRLQAYLPNHELLIAGPASAEELSTLQLLERELKEIPRLEPEVLVRIDLEMLDQNGKPLPDLVLKTVPETKLEQKGIVPATLAPWVSISDSDGWARLDGIPEIDLRIEAYAPSLPISPAWMLGSRTLLPTDGEDVLWKIPVSSISLSNLPAGKLLHGKRIQPEGTLPLTRIPPNGSVTFSVLPPGKYQFMVKELTFMVDAAAGEVTIPFQPIESPD